MLFLWSHPASWSRRTILLAQVTKKLFSPVSEGGGAAGCWIQLQTKRRNCQSLDAIRRGSSKVLPPPPGSAMQSLVLPRENCGESLESLESVDEKRIEFACSSKLSLNTKVIEKYTNFFFYSFVGTFVHLQVRKRNLCIT